MGLKKLFKTLLDQPETPDSDIDQLLNQFDATHPERSLSQIEEIAKHQRISKLRDDGNITSSARKLW